MTTARKLSRAKLERDMVMGRGMKVQIPVVRFDPRCRDPIMEHAAPVANGKVGQSAEPLAFIPLVLPLPQPVTMYP